MTCMHALLFHVLKASVITDGRHRAVYSRGERVDKWEATSCRPYYFS